MHCDVTRHCLPTPAYGVTALPRAGAGSRRRLLAFNAVATAERLSDENLIKKNNYIQHKEIRGNMSELTWVKSVTA